MKASTYITIITLAALLLTACEGEGDPSADGLRSEQVNLRSTIDPTTGGGNFTAGDTWGLYAYAGADAKLLNTSYTVGETVLLWKQLSETDPVTFSAHYPRITSPITDPTSYPFALTGVNATDDLLHASTTSSSGGTVSLAFRHLMHRLIINLKAGEGLADANLDEARISTISRYGEPTVRSGANVNLLTGEVSYLNYTDNTVLSNGTGSTADLILVPQDLKAGYDWIKVTLAHDTWIYRVPTSLQSSDKDHPTRLESGKRLTLNLTLSKDEAGNNEIELTSSDITAWETQAAIEDDVNADVLITPEELSEALTGTGKDPIVIIDDLTMTIESEIYITSDHTLTVIPGATLTLNGNNNISTSKDHTLTINGGGTIILAGTDYYLLNGNLNLENITIRLRNSKSYGILGYRIDVNKNAAIELDSETGMNLLYLNKGGALNMNGGSIIVSNFVGKGIISLGTITINEGGTIVLGEGQQLSNSSIPPQSLCLDSDAASIHINGGSLTGSDGGSVYLTGKREYPGGSTYGGCSLEGASNLFKKGSYVLDTDDEVEVASPDTQNAIAEGTYTWNDTDKMFVWTSLE